MPTTWDTIDRYVVISTDTHAGADLLDYRQYLPAHLHDDFDKWAKTYVSPFDDLIIATANRNWDHKLRITEMDADAFAAVMSETPAVHRFPGSMAKRVQDLARVIVDEYDGSAAALWTAGDPDGREVLRRLKALPGFGDQKARIFLALLGKQYGVTPDGWRAAAGDYGKAGTHMSVADVVDAASLDEVRSYKKAAKARAKQAGATQAGAKPAKATQAKA